MNKKIIFNQGKYITNLINLFLLGVFIFSLIKLGIETVIKIKSYTFILSLVLTSLFMYLFMRIIKEKFFYEITIYNDGEIKMYYPFNFFRNKYETISISKIEKITYYSYKYKSPSHCSFKNKKRKIKFDCSYKTAKNLAKVFIENGVEFIFADEKEVKFRG